MKRIFDEELLCLCLSRPCTLGASSDNGRHVNSDPAHASYWHRRPGDEVFTGEGKKPGQGSEGDIPYAVRKYRDFELSVDWKTAKAGNSGICFNVREVPGKAIYYAAPEVQVLDNVDATDNKVASHLAGSLYDMLAADPKSVKPVGEWNTIVVRVKDGKVTHTQNGMKVVEYTLWTPEWDAMVQNSKFKTFPGFLEGIAKEGYIGLQDHGYAIWFRNIKIREL